MSTKTFSIASVLVLFMKMVVGLPGYSTTKLWDASASIVEPMTTPCTTSSTADLAPVITTIYNPPIYSHVTTTCDTATVTMHTSCPVVTCEPTTMILSSTVVETMTSLLTQTMTETTTCFSTITATSTLTVSEVSSTVSVSTLTSTETISTTLTETLTETLTDTITIVNVISTICGGNSFGPTTIASSSPCPTTTYSTPCPTTIYSTPYQTTTTSYNPLTTTEEAIPIVTVTVDGFASSSVTEQASTIATSYYNMAVATY